jgi:hypothetical protein
LSSWSSCGRSYQQPQINATGPESSCGFLRNDSIAPKGMQDMRHIVADFRIEYKAELDERLDAAVAATRTDA